MLEYDDLKVHRTSISDSSADVYSNTQQNRIEGAAPGHPAAKQAVASRGEISFYWDQINQFVWELGKLEYSTDLEVYILKKLKELTGATAAVMSSYDEYTKTLNTRHVELDTWLANKVLSLLDKPINQIKSPVDDATYAEIFNTEIGMRKDLYESSFGAVNPTVSKAISSLLQADRFLGISFISDQRLLATAMIAMKANTPDPPKEILRAFSRIASLALKSQRVTDALKDSEERYRLLIDTMHEGVVIVDNDDVIQFVNPIACEIYGYPQDYLIGKVSYRLLVHPDDWHIIHNKNTSRHTGVSDSYVVRGNKRTGELIWLRISGAPIYDKFGKVIGSVGILSDITEMNESAERLRLQNAYLDDLIEGAAEAIVILDNEDRVRRINREFTNIFEYTPEEAFKQRINDLIVPEELKDEGWKATSDVAKGEKIHFETRRKTKSGKIINVSVLGNPIIFEGEQVGVYGIYRDITNRVRLEEQLLQSQRLDSIGQLAGGVAHDFNNILTIILGYSEQLSATMGEQSPHHKDIQEIINAGERAMKLTSQLLAFGRKQLIRPDVINLNSVISDMSKMLNRLITENIFIRTKLAENLGFIKADSSQVEQILLNLVVNARDAMPDGGKIVIETANITIESDRTQNSIPSGKYILLSVKDNGSGMSPETLSRIFEPFFTTKGFGRSSGLGLATVYGIVKQAEGYIEVDSEPTRGTTFRVYLPQCINCPECSEALKSQVAKSGRGEHILIVEDEEELRKLVHKIISKLGYTVTTARDAYEALARIDDEGLKPDLILSDVIMPGLNGKEMADIIRKNNPQQKVLFMSGYSEDIIGKHGVLEKDIAFIPKPFTRKQIADKIAELLRS